MANKPQWKQPWEYQSSKSPVGASTTTYAPSTADSMPLFSAPPDPSSGVPSLTSLRRLPPLHASLGASAEPHQASSRRNSIVGSPSDISSPNLAWQHEGSANQKRRRLQHPEEDGRYTSHAYSSPLSRDGGHHHAKSSHAQRSLPSSRLHDKPGGDGSQATNPPEVVGELESAAGRPTEDPSNITGSLTRCCPEHCGGDRCSSLRALLVDIVSEFRDLDLHLQGAITGGPVQSPRKPPDVEEVGIYTPLVWLLDGLQRNNAGIRSLVAPKPQTATHPEVQQSPAVPPPPPGSSEGNADLEESDQRVASPDTMKRRRAQADKEAQQPRRLAPALPAPSQEDTGHSAGSITGPYRQLPTLSSTGPQPPIPPSSPRPTMSASGSVFQHPQHSPSHESQQQQQQQQQQHGLQYLKLPSPSNLQFPSPHQSHVGPPPHILGGGPGAHELASSPTPAHLQHLQDLQHQVTVKTLALQTLQSEYDALLAKLERQRTKCTTLEKKFEVSDVEINSLTDERERLQSQVALLEGQAEDLTKGRDDARREMAESGRQYIRIVEMASKLQAQGADDRRKWEDERDELNQRIEVLERGLSRDITAEAGDFSVPSADTSKALPSVLTDIPAPSVLGGMQPITPVSSGETMIAGKEPTTESLAGVTSSGSSQVPPSQMQPSADSLGQSVSDPTPALREEVRRLRSRTDMLEGTIRNIMEQNRSMQNSLQSVNASGQRMQEALAKALGAG